MQLLVREPCRGLDFILNVEPTETVGNVKRMIDDRLQKGPTSLLFNGKVLREEYRLQDYSIQSGSTIHVVIALQG